MSQQLQLRRNTQPTIGTFTGAIGEVVVDSTNNRVVVSDGITAGGWAASKLNEVSRLSFLTTAVRIDLALDIQISISLPQGMTLYRVTEVVVGNPFGGVPDIAQVGVYTGSGRTGDIVAAQQSLTAITTNSQNIAGNSTTLTLVAPTTTTFNVQHLFFNVGTTNITTLEVDVLIVISPLS
jgi:Major tropism determinant N-terminal domain